MTVDTPECSARIPDAVVLLGKGGYGDWPQQELDRMVDAVRAGGRYRIVEGAFIDQGTPHLPKVLRACVDAGARRIVIAPVFVPVERSLREWLPKIVRRSLKKYHLDDVEVVLADALGDHPALGHAVARVVDDAAQKEEVRANAPPRDRADTWSHIPEHRYHALFCVGPRCATLGSYELWQHLRDRLAERGLNEDSGRVLVVRTGCLFPCNLGPVMVVYPDGAWYGALNRRAVDEIVDEHFVHGRPVEPHLRPRPRQRDQRGQVGAAPNGACLGETGETGDPGEFKPVH
ncbi:MAG: NAD(P)H-dependent oxidoreductase subunit E [Chloroflexi bacterium]|nr:NAD(P)H-dependent oxidoreductase subunit E [Chloroflexota bacterium]